MARKFGKLLILLVALTLAAAACGGDDTGGGTKVKGKEGGAAIGSFENPDALDPALSTTTTSAEVLNRVFDSLVHYDFKTASVLKTGAADDFTVSADATKITFKLREGAKFHNGDDVTAQSFVDGITRVALKVNASELAYHLEGIKGFADAQAGKANTLPGVHQGANENELVIELESANAEFVTRTGHTVFSPVPKSATNADGTLNKDFNLQPIGNGPYKMDGKWQENVQIKVSKFADYNGKVKGFLDSITWKIIDTIENQYLEFQGGTVDYANVPPEQYDAADAEYGAGFVDQLSAILTYVAVNNSAAPFKGNAKLRQAFSMAINREEIIKAVFAGRRIPATSIIPKVSVGHRPDVCKYCKFNLTEAKRLLEESGGVPKQTIVLTYNSDGAHADWIAATAAQLEKNLGIKTKIVPKQPFGEYLKFIDTDAVGPALIRLGWAQDYPTPDNWVRALFHSKAGDNHSRYSNPDVDRLTTDAQKTIDPAKRLKLQQDAEDIILEDMPVIPMWYSQSGSVYKTSKFATFPIDVQYANPVWELVSLK